LQVICPPSIGLAPGDYVAEQWTPLLEWDIRKDGERFKRQSGEDRLAFQRQRQWIINVDCAYSEYKAELAEGVPPGDARYVLPNATKTELAVTYNLRQWRHFFKVRCDHHAQWEIRNIATDILSYLEEDFPAVFCDLWEKYKCSE